MLRCSNNGWCVLLLSWYMKHTRTHCMRHGHFYSQPKLLKWVERKGAIWFSLESFCALNISFPNIKPKCFAWMKLAKLLSWRQRPNSGSNNKLKQKKNLHVHILMGEQIFNTFYMVGIFGSKTQNKNDKGIHKHFIFG